MTASRTDIDHHDHPLFAVTTDGERAHKAVMAERAQQRTRRLLAQPTWLLLLGEAGHALLIGSAAVLEQPLIASVLARVLSAAPDWQVQVGAVAYLAVYVALWHTVGERLQDAHQLSLASTTTGTSRRLNPAFGALGVALTAIAIAALLGIAVRRALSLADTAAQNAATKLVSTSIDSPTAAALEEARRGAWHSALWPDLAFTLSLMALLAALALWYGYRSPARHEALALHMARYQADTACARAEELAAAADDADRRATTQQQAADDRATQADLFDEALQERFKQAKTTVRHALSYQQGRPEATTTLAGHHPPTPVG